MGCGNPSRLEDDKQPPAADPLPATVPATPQKAPGVQRAASLPVPSPRLGPTKDAVPASPRGILKSGSAGSGLLSQKSSRRLKEVSDALKAEADAQVASPGKTRKDRASGNLKDMLGGEHRGESGEHPGMYRQRLPSSDGKQRPKLVRKPSHSGMISRLALQFPIIRRSFTRVQKAFNQYHQETASDKTSVTANRLGNVLQTLTSRTFTDQEVKLLFSLSDLDGSKTISFQEFLIAVAVGYFLKDHIDGHKDTSPQNSPQPSPMASKNSLESDFKEVQKGFYLVYKAFCDMDDDNSKTVDPQELKSALFAGSFDSEKDILEARFKELDFNGDGGVTFPEFLYGFAQWVGFEEDEDEDNKLETRTDEQRGLASLSLGRPAPYLSVPGTSATGHGQALTPPSHQHSASVGSIPLSLVLPPSPSLPPHNNATESQAPGALPGSLPDSSPSS